MSHLFSPPESSPLQRLFVEDGLLLNAERWQSAHAYHRHRQNLHYQSLNQPGIICGLGVSVISAPENVAAKYRDGRWIKIASGIAIDLLGNPIIVPESMEFHVASQAQEEALLIYITISYVDPENLHRSESKDIIEETFCIDEKINRPHELEVELCRILLLPGVVSLAPSNDVFFPAVNHLDLRYRQQATARPEGVLQVGLILENSPVDQTISSNLSGLIQSLPGLYSAILGVTEIGQFKLQIEEINEYPSYNLLYLSYQKLATLTEAETEILREYTLAGGVIFVELTITHTEIGQLMEIEQKLQKALANFDEQDNLQEIRQQLQTELETTTTILKQQVGLATSTVRNLAQNIGEVTTGNSGEIHRQHPLRNQPFLFSKFPAIAQQEIKVFNWGGIILVLGNISSAWGLDEELNLPRGTIRNAQEMGINILHFAWKRRQLTQLQH
jgi:hypothetical protein